MSQDIQFALYDEAGGTELSVVSLDGGVVLGINEDGVESEITLDLENLELLATVLRTIAFNSVKTAFEDLDTDLEG